MLRRLHVTKVTVALVNDEAFSLSIQDADPSSRVVISVNVPCGLISVPLMPIHVRAPEQMLYNVLVACYCLLFREQDEPCVVYSVSLVK